MVKPTLSIPTGYEADQLKAERKRKIAQKMLEMGLSPPANMTSWTQVLASIADAYVGKRLDKKADDLDAATRARMISDYTKASGDFSADAKSSNADPQAMIDKYGTNPWLQDDLKPYQDAIAKRLTERENIVSTPTTYARQGDLIGKPKFDPNANMIPTGVPGEYQVNAGAVSGALLRQGFGIQGGNTTIHDPTMAGPPPQMPMPQGQPQGLGAPTAPPAQMPPPPGQGGPTFDGPPGNNLGGLDLSLLSPQEKQILQSELARRASGNGAFTPPNANVPMGNPLTAQRAPAGVVNGKPYWLINGVPYDNPEGK